MIRPTVFNKVVSELNELRLNMVIVAKTEQDRRDIVLLFDLALNTLYSEMKAQRKDFDYERRLPVHQEAKMPRLKLELTAEEFFKSEPE